MTANLVVSSTLRVHIESESGRSATNIIIPSTALFLHNFSHFWVFQCQVRVRDIMGCGIVLNALEKIFVE